MENLFHRYLQLPFDITPPSFFKEHFDSVQHEELDPNNYPHVLDFFDRKGLEIFECDCFYTPPGDRIGIHTDYHEFTNHIKLNQTWGPEEGAVRWWHSDKIIRVTNPDAIEDEEVITAKDDDCELIFQANTNRPSMINAGRLHSTYNPTEQGRWTICFVPCYKGTRSKTGLVTKKIDGLVNFADALNIFKSEIDDLD